VTNIHFASAVPHAKCNEDNITFKSLKNATEIYNIFRRYGDGAGNTIEENSSIFSLIQMR